MTYFGFQNTYDIDELRNQSFWEFLPDLHGDRVFIKPNLVMPPTERESASTTHINIVKVVIEKLKEKGVSNIFIGDSGFKGNWGKTINLSGYSTLPKEYGVELIGLQEGENFHKFTMVRNSHESLISEQELVQSKGYASLFGFKISDYVLGSDWVFNVPKLKIHKMARITCSIKNMMGVIAEKGSMHPNASVEILHKRLYDLYFAMRDRVKFILVDGIMGSEYSEHMGIPKQTGVLIFGQDMFEVDAYSSNILGVYWGKVDYLRYIGAKLGITRAFNPPEETEFEEALGYI